MLWLENITPEGHGQVRKIDFTGVKGDKFHRVSCESLCRDYVPIKVEYENADYPSKGPLNNSTWELHEYSAKVTLALGILTRHYGEANVVCRTLPKKSVCALQNFASGSCYIVPTTIKVKAVKECDSDSILACGGHAPEGYVFELAPGAMPTTIPCPAWFMKDTDTKKYANMKVVMVKVKLNASCKDTSDSSTIEVPVFVNSRALKASDELVYYKARDVDSRGVKRPFDLI